MKPLTEDEIRAAVRENYGTIATSEEAGCCAPSCCGSDAEVSQATTSASAADLSLALGYSEADVTTVPEGANMGLGCGNPQAIASISGMSQPSPRLVVTKQSAERYSEPSW